ncbi:transcriptional regulator family: bZIP [Agaricus bisporus var. burnettii]|uniref:Transcriptional regulator family: bZIP n=1 Tax=Agaricus bisporus var. burnettii TaxID=192524 RepID=A0A8H7C8H3_AGABI|nr:transcriptional regulator family: bZIP [Agaricus bisporus var. burnettii]
MTWTAQDLCTATGVRVRAGVSEFEMQAVGIYREGLQAISAHPPPGLPSTVSASPQTTCLPLNVAIFSPAHLSYYNTLRHHASPLLSSSQASRSNASGPLVPKHLSPNNDINNSLTRPRTSNQVFSSTSDLAAHHGIPTTLPPLPKIPSTRIETVTQPEVNDFFAVRDNYLNMLSQKSEPAASSSTEMHSATVSPADLQQPLESDFDLESMLRNLAPGGVSEPDMSPFEPSDFLTSPWTPSLDNFGESPGETPLSDFLSTPLIAHNDVSMLTGPHDMPLFDSGMIDDESSKVPTLDTSSLFTMSPTSPTLNTPALNPASLVSPSLGMDNATFSPSTLSHAVDQVPSSAPETARRRVSATGTRKNISTDSLVSLEAPTQPRRYLTPSATSRKEMPAVFARKRVRQQMLDGDDDDLELEALKPNATELEQIEWKRRQNTLAARKSRKRKLQHQQELENQVSDLANDRDKWKERALTLQRILQANGIPFSEFQD